VSIPVRTARLDADNRSVVAFLLTICEKPKAAPQATSGIAATAGPIHMVDQGHSEKSLENEYLSSISFESLVAVS